MFKILIVDDEKIVLDAVKFILDNNFPNKTVYETARSGREAIEKADTFSPNIILMDIRMPGINGIEAIKEIKIRHPKAHFVIVSANEQFDFAKEAVELNVHDYILKPIIKSKLVAVLEKIMMMITSEREGKKKELEIIDRYERVVPYLEYGFIYSVISGEHYGSKQNEYTDVLEFEGDGGYVIIVEAEKRTTYGNDDEKGGLEEESYYSIIKEALKCKCKCFVGPVLFNKVIAFIHSSYKGDRIIENEAIEISEYINKKVKSYNNDNKLHIGIGGYKGLNNISESYDEALIALRNRNYGEIVFYKDVSTEEFKPTEFPKELEMKLLDKLSSGDEVGAISVFYGIYEWIYQNFKNSLGLGKAKLIELFVLIHREAFNKGVRENEYTNYIVDLYNNGDHLKLEDWCKNRIRDLISDINSINNKKNSRIIVQAKEYIYENYSNDITLEDVARSVSVTPHYLSRLFKEETGENFIEYLTVFRIKRAKKMMDKTNLNIKEICFKIGYTDPNYFSRLFKKVEKITPTDYMKNINKG